VRDLFDECIDGDVTEIPSELEKDVERYRAFVRVYSARISYKPSDRLWESVLKRRKFKRRFVFGLAVAAAAIVIGVLGIWNALGNMWTEQEYARAVENAIETLSNHPVELPQPMDTSDYLGVIGFVSDVF